MTNRTAMKAWMQKFNDIYDFAARIFKIVFLVLIGGILLVQCPKLDINESAKRLVERSTPFSIQSESPPVSATEPELDPLYIYQLGNPIFRLDRVYPSVEGPLVVEEALIVGEPDYQKDFEYKGSKFRLSSIKERIGLLISNRGARGPVLRGVNFIPID